jgi:hypothetical protein
VDCGSADHPMNTIIRDWMPRQARQAEKVFKKKHGRSLAEFFDDSIKNVNAVRILKDDPELKERFGNQLRIRSRLVVAEP